ncbi:hypothetical protein TWF730_004220 [Orbilia blumenaviensis]|uniref:Uncharacterized protein n=1 Tax=Orbilia blumenaviensis TaxID=1796055 RepID=A0AAV9U3X2_9PEZI
MGNFSRFNILVLALITFASFCTARTVITINGSCATRYCGSPVPKSKIRKAVKTFCTTVPYTVTRWKTVTKPKTTTTIRKTKKISLVVTKTISTVTSTATKSSKVTRTSTFTVTVPRWIATGSITTFTLQSPTVTIPAPSGFVGVNDDPDNVKSLPPINPLARRDAKAEPEPGNHPRYITAITCTKTLLTKTGTSDLCKTTTKTIGTAKETVWTTQTIRSTKTVTKKGAVTVRTTVTKYTTVSAVTTRSVTRAATSFFTTETVSVPRATYYAACGIRNQGPPPDERRYYAAEAAPFADEKIEIIMSNGTIYDCCVACQTWAGPGTCMGSVYNFAGFWGDPGPWPCEDIQLPGFPTCPPPPVAKFSSKCELAISDSKSGTCRRQKYEYWWYTEQPPTVVSNGPGCKRFKYRGRGAPL